MNARQQLKPKTIRLAILLALASGAITTIDDLQTKIDEPRKKVAGAVYPAAIEGLIKRMRDDVTSAPAYQITAAGREYLAKYSGEVAEPGLPEAPVCTESQTAAITPGVKTDFPAFHEPTASAIVGAMAFGYQGSNEPPEGHWLAEFHQRGAADAWKDGEIVRLREQYADACGLVARMHAAAMGEVCAPAIGAVEDVAAVRARLLHIELMVRNSSAKAVGSDASVEDLLGEILHQSAHQQSPAGYITQRPGKPLARFTKAENAQARAMSAARGGKRAQVFALVPVGAAMPGAEWVAA